MKRGAIVILLVLCSVVAYAQEMTCCCDPPDCTTMNCACGGTPPPTATPCTCPEGYYSPDCNCAGHTGCQCSCGWDANCNCALMCPISGGSGVAIGGGVPALVTEAMISKNIALGKGLSNATFFDMAIDHSSLSTLFEGTIIFGGSIYNTSEELQLKDQDDPAVATSLTTGEDDFKANVYVTTSRSKILYAYKFDEPINFSAASTTNPLTINFLGRKLKITHISDADTFTAYVGDEISSKTYNDGDAYIGENETYPDWVWALDRLTSAGTDQMLGVENYYRKKIYTDKPIGAGGCYTFPNDYLSVCLGNLTVADTNLGDYTFEIDTATALDQAIGSAYASEPAIYIHTGVTGGLELRPEGTMSNVSSTIRTKNVWLSLLPLNALNGTADSQGSFDKLAVFYKDSSDSRVKLYGTIATANNNADTTILRINNGNTKDENMVLAYSGGSNASRTLNLTLKVAGDLASDLAYSDDNLKMVWGIFNADLGRLGLIADTEEAGEMIYGSWNTPIGAKDEDHRTRYGTIIRNPKSNSAAERVLLSIPPDQVYANVTIKGTYTLISEPAPPQPSFSEILTDMQALVGKLRTTEEYGLMTNSIEPALRTIEKQIEKLKKLVGATAEEEGATEPQGSKKTLSKSLVEKIRKLLGK